MKLLPLMLILLAAGAAATEPLKPFIPAEPEMKAFWWPVYIDNSGARQEKLYGLPLGEYPTAQDGSLLSNIETVIYARALYKPRLRGITSLEALIESEQAEFRRRNPEVSVEELETVSGSDGKPLRSFAYLPKRRGDWERVTYSEEGEFYLLFTLRSKSQQRYQQDMESYLSYIRQYRSQLLKSSRQFTIRQERLRLQQQ